MRISLAGLPAHSSPRFTRLPGVTRAPAATMAPDSTTTPSITQAFMPTKQPSSSVQACSSAMWPTVMSAPIVVLVPAAPSRS